MYTLHIYSILYITEYYHWIALFTSIPFFTFSRAILSCQPSSWYDDNPIRFVWDYTIRRKRKKYNTRVGLIFHHRHRFYRQKRDIETFRTDARTPESNNITYIYERPDNGYFGASNTFFLRTSYYLYTIYQLPYFHT